MNPIEFSRLLFSTWTTQVEIIRKLTEAAYQQPLRPAPVPHGAA
jgi:hypothetical protein